MLEAALYAKVPVADLQRLLLGESQSGVNLGPYFRWTGSLRAAFATAETYSEAAGKWGAASRRLMTACLRNKNIAALKVVTFLCLCQHTTHLAVCELDVICSSVCTNQGHKPSP